MRMEYTCNDDGVQTVDFFDELGVCMRKEVYDPKSPDDSRIEIVHYYGFKIVYEGELITENFIGLVTELLDI